MSGAVTLAMAVAMMAGLAVPVVAEGAICVEASGEVCVDEFQSFAGRGAGNDRQAGLLKVRFGAMAEPATEHGVSRLRLSAGREARHNRRGQ